HTPPKTGKEWIKGPAKALLNAWGRVSGRKEITWMPVRVPLRAVRKLSDQYLPDADLLIATENQTIDPLDLVSDKKGKKIYFIQHYETWSRAEKEVDATWKSPKWHKVTIATWLVNLAKEKFHSHADLVVNGVDISVFHPKGRKTHTPPRVLSLYHHLEWKGIKDTIQAMAAVQKKGIPFTPVFFGHLPAGSDLDVLEGVEYHLFPHGETLRQLYASAEIFVSASWAEGCQLPPMEAMACKAALIASNVGGVPDYTIPGKTALVVEPKHPGDLAAALEDLLLHPEKRTKIADAGYDHIQKFSWENVADTFETLLQNIHQGTHV
ncbi:MAG TPA: glycosyltransferase family 4 protein, partial [Patescibacteria group bacterium]